MAINWQWSDKMGSCVYDTGWASNLYRGNCFCIAVNEFENNTYNLAWFAADESHMKNMLGLTKGYNSCFEDFRICKLRLNTRYKESVKLVTLLAKAKASVIIELYNE